MIRIGVIGYGYWGPNLVRNCFETHGVQVASVSDLRADRLAAGEQPLSDGRYDAELSRANRGSFHRRGCHRHPGFHPLRISSASAARGQARAGGKAFGLGHGPGAALDGCRAKAQPGADGGSHVRLYGRGPQDPRTSRERQPRGDLLLRFGAREPRPVSARRERVMGSRSARLVDHGLRAAVPAVCRVSDGTRAMYRAARRTSRT